MPPPENAIVGWEVYRDSDHELTLGDINSELASRGLGPVSPRMFTHYRKLQRYGYEQYIPINQLDVRTMENPVWDKALRGRYPLFPVSAGVRVIVLTDDEPVALEGVAEELSDGEVIFRLGGEDALTAFGGSRSVWTLEVLFTDSGELRLCDVAKVTLDRRRSRVTVRAAFMSIAPAESAVIRQLLPVRTFRLVVGRDVSSPLLGQATQQLYWAFAATEGARILVADVLGDLGSGSSFTVSGTRIRSLSVASPLVAVAITAAPVTLVLGSLIGKIVTFRKSWWEGTLARDESAVAREEAVRLRWERRRREDIASIDTSDLATVLVQTVASLVGTPASASADQIDRLAQRMAELILPALGELVEAGQGAVEFEEVDDGDG